MSQQPIASPPSLVVRKPNEPPGCPLRRCPGRCRRPSTSPSRGRGRAGAGRTVIDPRPRRGGSPRARAVGLSRTLIRAGRGPVRTRGRAPSVASDATIAAAAGRSPLNEDVGAFPPSRLKGGAGRPLTERGGPADVAHQGARAATCSIARLRRIGSIHCWFLRRRRGAAVSLGAARMTEHGPLISWTIPARTAHRG